MAIVLCRTVLFIVCMIGGMVRAQGASESAWYVFSLNSSNGKLGEADVSRLNDAPAGRDGFLSVKDGHFVDPSGRRVRFFATNLTATACFPEPEAAPLLAARLRALGFNLVRLHYMDIAAPNGLFQQDLLTIDPDQLARLDGLIAALKAEGIYVNLNLHVARCYPGIEGEAARRFHQGKMLDRFYPAFIEMQKDYARDLLTHVNPHTGLAYAEEPAIMCIELNNENTLLPFWFDDPYEFPEKFGSELKLQWNRWLQRKYGTTEKLRLAWKHGSCQPGDEILLNADLKEGVAEWESQTGGNARADLTVIPASSSPGAAPHAGSSALRWRAFTAGTANWHLQLMQTGLTLETGKDYELSFHGRADEPLELEVTAMLGVDPWSNLGLLESAALSPKWKRFQFRFKARDSGGPHGRINFSTRNKTGECELAGFSLRRAASEGLPRGESLEDSSVSLRHAGGTPALALDYWSFLIETERTTTSLLISYLKNELKVRQPVCDTQADYGSVAGVLRERDLSDFIDMHGYWEHPAGGWVENWTIGNHSQVTSEYGGTLADIAIHRVKGKPFTVSEYNIPNPNDHGAETLPMLAVFGAFQDWDAIYAYTFLDFKRDWNADRLLGFFDFAGNSGKLAFAPSAALAFRLGLVAPGGPPVVLTIPADGAAKLWAEGRPGLAEHWDAGGVPRSGAYLRRLEISVGPAGEPIGTSESLRIGRKRRSDTGELLWIPEGDHPVFTVSAPSFRMAAGLIAGRKLKLGDISVEFGPLEKDYVCITLVSLDGKEIDDSSRLLITLAARYENQEMGWNSERTSVDRNWGRGPARAELVPATLILPGAGWLVNALDGAGQIAASLPVDSAGRRSLVRLGTPETASLLYLASR